MSNGLIDFLKRYMYFIHVSMITSTYVHERWRMKEGRSKQGHTNNKAIQLSYIYVYTESTVLYMYLCIYRKHSTLHVSMYIQKAQYSTCINVYTESTILYV